MVRKSGSLAAGVGSALAALLASSCCWLPLLLLAGGASAGAVGGFVGAIEKMRPLLTVLSIGGLGAAFYLTYFRPARTPESCCAPAPDGVAREATCSCCGTKGKRVPARTVHALVREHLRAEVRDGEHILCLEPGCAQVYTGPAGSHPFVKSDLSVRVGFKEQSPPHVVCYCFGHSVEDIEAELRTAGRTTIPGRIRAEVTAGRCACDVKNPQGACCLGAVGAAVKAAQDRIAGRSSAPVGAPADQCAPSPSVEEDHGACCGLTRSPASPTRATGGVRRLNRILLPIVSVPILGANFFPHEISSIFVGKEASLRATTDANLRTVVLHVPGMT